MLAHAIPALRQAFWLSVLSKPRSVAKTSGSDEDGRPHDPDELRRVALYPVLDRRGINRTPRADGFHAFRRAASKYLRKGSGLEMAAVQLGHKRMTTTDEHYNDRDLEDLKKAAELVETAFGISFAPDR